MSYIVGTRWQEIELFKVGISPQLSYIITLCICPPLHGNISQLKPQAVLIGTSGTSDTFHNFYIDSTTVPIDEYHYVELGCNKMDVVYQ